ncbi:carbon-nitrogen hydrolase [Aaosphaeria arxii CBS 175.79]|uniref:nitrilase n=1 Tax=Aaosphaeria arxii CBS 175.79 TaxID=1450172 RepID=A0A6A5X7Q4_9PLEO|nr:carbon-nitrogen hydrolase [Aaosphaeria arxii CBS 175.79]KAF2008951.1 carbon-nitrogen hydrolase [Aaosphaeria arxii CBS 175.79]
MMKLLTRVFLLLPLAGVYAAPCLPSIDRGNLTVALVRAPPPNWPLPIDNKDYRGVDLNMTAVVETGISLMHAARANGADVVAFPELWFPGHPKGELTDDYFRETYLPLYADSAMVLGDKYWTRLTAAVREIGIYAQINFAEREDDHIYMSQALAQIAAIRRRKRYIFSDGTVDGLQVIRTAYGRWGMLECFEHYWPSMTFNMHVQQESLHFTAFPYLQDSLDPTAPWFANDVVNQGAVSTYAIQGNTWTLTPAVGSAFIHDPTGIMVANVSANVSFEQQPFLYHSINTTEFDLRKPYDLDGQFSWGILDQIVNSFPASVPKKEGSMVPQLSVSIKDVIKPGKAGQKA